ncbi:hypothetical protein K461DRAFT_315121 [Myriangium duriaei CBS 260.36]|uniref:G-protein coupled receptors family 1 profile domain-containing protein n=1 Tax=Myriangium duriaei CBS 260.36 TaxID=1168546 RepID=A0A9P4IWG8_9PEZI|nr:hypothetical protein K461DRAFT_315121 [Myriangium duriaei CBS 260.36]
MVAITLLQRGLGSSPSSNPIYSDAAAQNVRILGVALSCLSLLSDVGALYWFYRMKKKFRHTLIMFLLVADLLKSINYIVFGSVVFAQGKIASKSHYCQANGLFNQYFTEITDLVILAIVVHMSVQILVPDTTAISEGGLHRYKKWVFAGIVCLPFVDACIAFSNKNGGYTAVGAFCNLPVRPFWYRLFLSWVPRYLIAMTILTLTIIVRFKVKGYQRKLAELQPAAAPVDVDEIVEEIIEEQDESDEEAPGSPAKHMDSLTADPEKQDMTIVTSIEFPPLPSEHEQFNAIDLRKFKRMSYKRRQLPPINTTGGADVDAPRTHSVGAPSIAPSSAVFSSPRRDLFATDMPNMSRQSTNLDLPTPISPITSKPAVGRRQSVADFSTMRSLSTEAVPPLTSRPRVERRRSLVDMSSPPRSGSVSRQSANLTSSADRMNSMPLSTRRSSIWDEIDASLEKKVNPNRMSIFTITASECPSSRPHSPERQSSPVRDSTYSASLARASRISKRQSKIYDIARRTMSIVSLRGVEPEEDPESPAAILRRRHRYIQRQTRFMMFYPALYILLWFFPFVLHAMQYSDKFAAHPPFALAVLNIISVTVFGLVNSVVFCLREKPWAMILDNVDGTVGGSLRTDPVVRAVKRYWNDVRGVEGDEMDFAG